MAVVNQGKTTKHLIANDDKYIEIIIINENLYKYILVLYILWTLES